MGERENRLRAARAYAGLTQDEFAVHLETSRATIERIETGLKTVDPDKERWIFERASQVTGFPLDFLLDERGGSPVRRPADGVATIELKLNGLAKRLDDLARQQERQIDKLARGTASDRGRLTKIEKNLNLVAEAVFEGLERRAKGE